MKSNRHRPLRVAVIGAGVAGCLVVQGLSNEPDVELICLEKGPKDNILAGTGLNVGPNAIAVLQQFNPELAALLQAEGVSLPWLTWQAGLTDGTVIIDLPLSRVADCPGIRIRWAELYDHLRQQIADYIHYHTVVVEMGYSNKSDSEPLYLVTENKITGDRQRFDAVDLIVGCDGRYSQVRQTFFGLPQPRYLGVCVYRLLVPNSPDRIVDDYQQWFHNGSRLLTFAIPGDEVYIAGSFPIIPRAEIPETAKTAAFLQQCYQPAKGYSDVCQFLVNAICDNIERIHWARLQEIPTVFGDRYGHVICLGDSAHAMVPTLGQGATQAFEDGCVFASQLRQAVAAARDRGDRLNVPALISDFESQRRQRIEFVKNFSWQASDSLLAGSNPRQELQTKTQTPFLQKLAKLYKDTPPIISYSHSNVSKLTHLHPTLR